MALAFAGVILIGFGYEVPGYVLHPPIPRPAIMWVHGVAMFGWVALYIAQTALIGAGNLGLHRRLGLLGGGLAIVLPPLMMVAAWVMTRFDLVAYPGPSRARDIAFLGILIWDVVQFSTLAGLGLARRRQPEMHRRLMFLAMCGLLSAGLGRFPVPWGPAGTELGTVWGHVGVDLVIAAAMMRDWLRDGRVHGVFLVALPGIITAQVFVDTLLIVHPRWWVAAMAALLGVTPG